MNKTNQTSNNELQKFGITTGIIVAGLFGLLLPWLFNFTIPYWPWAVSSILILWAFIHPASLKHIFLTWMKFGHIMGWINSRIILGIMFYFIFLPTAVILKILGKDPLHKKLDEKISSYRIKSPQKPKEHIERPF
ncbi:MAG: SxtJ family membrane protein [Gammaproteobacteria bacterium]|nr:SxtJ family membrane protein [Gammaproteobacteria bacterium]